MVLQWAFTNLYFFVAPVYVHFQLCSVQNGGSSIKLTSRPSFSFYYRTICALLFLREFRQILTEPYLLGPVIFFGPSWLLPRSIVVVYHMEGRGKSRPTALDCGRLSPGGRGRSRNTTLDCGSLSPGGRGGAVLQRSTVVVYHLEGVGEAVLPRSTVVVYHPEGVGGAVLPRSTVVVYHLEGVGGGHFMIGFGLTEPPNSWTYGMSILLWQWAMG